MKSVDYIVTAKHYSIAEGADGTVRGRILHMRDKFHREKNTAIQITDIDSPSGDPVYARIWQGQWIADCSCNGAQFVDPSEPIFFCFNCLNRANAGRPRPVVFPLPEERAEIERMLLERPVDDQAGMTDLERAGMARPMIVVALSDGKSIEHKLLGRDWTPGETVEDVRNQNSPIDSWKRAVSKGKAPKPMIVKISRKAGK